MGVMFLLGVAVGSIVMAILVKRYKYGEWYLEGQRSIIEAMAERRADVSKSNV